MNHLPFFSVPFTVPCYWSLSCFPVAVTKCLMLAIWRGLIRLMAVEAQSMASFSRAEHDVRRVWRKKAAHIMVGRKQRERSQEPGIRTGPSSSHPSDRLQPGPNSSSTLSRELIHDESIDGHNPLWSGHFCTQRLLGDILGPCHTLPHPLHCGSAPQSNVFLGAKTKLP